MKLKGYIFYNINRMTINTHPPSHPNETKINIIIAKNPYLLDHNTNYILIRKKSHIAFIN